MNANVFDGSFDFVSALEDGDVLVKVITASADPYLRGRIKSSSFGPGGMSPGSPMTVFVSGKSELCTELFILEVYFN